MERRFLRAQVLSSVLAVLLMGALTAQRSAAQSTGDSVFNRAQRLIAEGQGDAARALVQAQLDAAPTGSARYVEALYWRAVLAANPAESERDLKRLVIDYPLSLRAADALLRLGQLEIARGDRQQAITHLDRIVKEHAESGLRPRASYWMARAWFDEGSVPTACARLGDATRGTPADSVELRNQISYYAQRCVGVDTSVQATAAVRAKPGAGGVIIAGPAPRPAASSSPGTPRGSSRPLPPLASSTPREARDTAPRVAIRRDSMRTTPRAVRDTNGTDGVRRDTVGLRGTRSDTVGTRELVHDTGAMRELRHDTVGLRGTRADTVGLRGTRSDTVGTRELVTTGTTDIVPSGRRPASMPTTASSSETVLLPPARARGDTTRISPAATVPVAAGAPATAPATAPAHATPSRAAPVQPARTTESPAPARSGQWTVQVGAYKTRAEAEQLRKSVAERGYEPRIWENDGWFRVRVGRYQTRAAATAAAEAMKQKRIAVYVTDAEAK